MQKMRTQLLLSLAANCFRVVFGFVFFWQVSQALGLSTLGDYIYVTAALGYFGTLIDYGFNLFVLNSASRSLEKVRAIFFRVMISKLILTGIAITLLGAVFPVAFSAQGLSVTALFLAVVILQSFSGLLIQFFKAMGRFEHELTSSILSSILPVGVLFALSGSVTLVTLGWVLVIVRLVVLLFQLGVLCLMTREQSWLDPNDMSRRHISRALNDIRSNSRYAVFSILGAVFLSADLVVMRFVLGPEEVSIYGTAMKVIMAGILLFEVLNGTFIPRLAQAHAGKGSVFSVEAKRFVLTMIGLGAIVSSAVFAFGPAALLFAFGPEFEQAGSLVRLLSIVLFLRVTEMTTGPLLTVYGLQTFRSKAMFIVLPIHLVANIALQNQLGVWGAVITLAFSFSLLFALNSLYLIRKKPSG